MSDQSLPWMPGDGMSVDPRRHAPATRRNADAIVAVLRNVMPPTGTVLELASGSGEHAVTFARAFPALTWQPSDPDPAAMASIAAHSADAALSNLLLPLELDVRDAHWPIERADAVLCINMVHISPWEATLAMLKGAAGILPPRAPLCLYGAYWREGVEAAPSNLAFDTNLRARDLTWGLRRLEDVVEVAQARGFALEQVVDMPANNLSVVLRRA